jgi:pimeloyl-ACP methyl ester carboxylesterase
MFRRTVHLVHGYNVTDGGKGTTGTLKPHFNAEGFETLEHSYGWIGLIEAYLRNESIAADIAETVHTGDIGVGHSNGCALLLHAATKGAPLDGLVLINPALDRDTVFPSQLRWIHVYYNAGDMAVRLAQLIPNWLNKRWGDMGAKGYVGKDRRVKQFDCGRGKDPVSGHSAIFKHYEWRVTIAKRARNESLKVA